MNKSNQDIEFCDVIRTIENFTEKEYHGYTTTSISYIKGKKSLEIRLDRASPDISLEILYNLNNKIYTSYVWFGGILKSNKKLSQWFSLSPTKNIDEVFSQIKFENLKLIYLLNKEAK